MSDEQRSDIPDEGITMYIPTCETCPPLKDWPMKNLALGHCPKCMRVNDNGWREASARRLIEERESAA